MSEPNPDELARAKEAARQAHERAQRAGEVVAAKEQVFFDAYAKVVGKNLADDDPLELAALEERIILQRAEEVADAALADAQAAEDAVEDVEWRAWRVERDKRRAEEEKEKRARAVERAAKHAADRAAEAARKAKLKKRYDDAVARVDARLAREAERDEGGAEPSESVP